MKKTPMPKALRKKVAKKYFQFNGIRLKSNEGTKILQGLWIYLGRFGLDDQIKERILLDENLYRLWIVEFYNSAWWDY